MIARILPLLLLPLPATAQTFSIELPDTMFVQDVVELAPGQVAVTGWHPGNTSSVTSLDPSGQPLVRRASSRWITCMARDAAGGLLVGGSIDPTGVERGYAGRLDAALGSDTWSGAETQFAPDLDAQVVAVTGSSAGGCIALTMTDYASSGSSGPAAVSRFADDGTLLWCRTLDLALRYGDVLELPDGTIWVILCRHVGKSTLVALSPTGDLLWARKGPNGGAVPRIALRSQGEVVVTYITGEIQEFDASGQLLRARALQRDGFPERIQDVAATTDGGFAVLGDLPASDNTLDVHVLRFDAQGAPLWSRRIGGPGEQWGASIASLADGGLVVGGTSDATGGSTVGMVLRMDAGGNIDGCLPLSAPFELADLSIDWTTATLGVTDATEPWNAGPKTTAAAAESVSVCYGGGLGVRVCSPAVPNSSGQPAALWVLGSPVVSDGDVTLLALDLARQQNGYFLAGQSFGTVVPPGSQGVLCLAGGPIRRFRKNVLYSGTEGKFELAIDPTDIPDHGAILPGETWLFQAWFRDVHPTVTSNFSDAVGVTFE